MSTPFLPGRRAGALLLASVLLLAGDAEPAAVGASGSAVATPGSGSRASSGSIEGVVELPAPSRRRSPARYGSRGGPPPRPVQDVPAIVYLRGDTGAGPSPDATMAQEDTTFAPAALVVSPGTVVEFPNRDPFFHNVFSYSAAARFDLGRYPRGESKEVTFDEEGLVQLFCEVHEHMRALVLVTRSRHRVVVGPDGRFTLDGVPSGEWTLVLHHADHDPVERAVNVPDGGTVQVTLSLD